mmetsp:Transcript_35250/g.82544  ORF Transcript_35250/g.82544 Transcript_35250/m.82544 type:complete len:226 (-) Transcript_35250:319-996(-)
MRFLSLRRDTECSVRMRHPSAAAFSSLRLLARSLTLAFRSSSSSRLAASTKSLYKWKGSSGSGSWRTYSLSKPATSLTSESAGISVSSPWSICPFRRSIACALPGTRNRPSVSKPFVARYRVAELSIQGTLVPGGSRATASASDRPKMWPRGLLAAAPWALLLLPCEGRPLAFFCFPPPPPPILCHRSLAMFSIFPTNPAMLLLLPCLAAPPAVSPHSSLVPRQK